jgi:hypothetical protein
MMTYALPASLPTLISKSSPSLIGNSHAQLPRILLDLSEYWPKGLDDWAATYEQRLATFVRMLEA